MLGTFWTCCLWEFKPYLQMLPVWIISALHLEVQLSKGYTTSKLALCLWLFHSILSSFLSEFYISSEIFLIINTSYSLILSSALSKWLMFTVLFISIIIIFLSTVSMSILSLFTFKVPCPILYSYFKCFLFL